MDVGQPHSEGAHSEYITIPNEGLKVVNIMHLLLATTQSETKTNLLPYCCYSHPPTHKQQLPDACRFYTKSQKSDWSIFTTFSQMYLKEEVKTNNQIVTQTVFELQL